jgi:hypothetical protein
MRIHFTGFGSTLFRIQVPRHDFTELRMSILKFLVGHLGRRIRIFVLGDMILGRGLLESVD